MQTQPLWGHQRAIPGCSEEPSQDALRPYAKPQVWTYTNEQLLAILGPARTGGASDPFGPFVPNFDPSLLSWDDYPYFRPPAAR
jgi:hypothetical protein